MKDILFFLFQLGFRPAIFLLALILSLLSALFEGTSIGLLVPLINGIVSSDFTFANELPFLGYVLKKIFRFLPERNLTIFSFLVLVIFTSAVLKNSFYYFSSICMLYQVRFCSNILRKKIYDRYLSFGKLFFDKSNIGHLHQVLTTYTQLISNELYQMQGYLYNVFTLLIYLVIMMVISPKLTLMVLVSFPFFYFSLTKLIKMIEESSLTFANVYSDMGKKISNALMCIPLVMACKSEQKEQRWFSELSDSVQRIEFSIDKKRNLISPVQEISILAVVLLLIAVIALLYFKGSSMSIAGSLVFLLVLRRSAGLIGSFNNIRSSLAYLQGPFAEIRNLFDDKDKYFIVDGLKEFKGIENCIRFEDVSFSYIEGLKALKDVGFSIEKGKLTALVGQTGAGKTTVINLLMRFYDLTWGQITYDGVNIKEFTLRSLRSKIALVTQETYLLNDSLDFNLVYGLDLKPSREKIREVLKRARLYEFVEKLPMKLETNIGDRGIRLSGGEKQRLSIARAMLKDPEILILDEATSSLDSETENLIQQALEDLIKGKTVIVIAHRLSTIKHADKIIVLENGEVVEEGTLSDLVHKKNKFYELWVAQKF